MRSNQTAKYGGMRRQPRKEWKKEKQDERKKSKRIPFQNEEKSHPLLKPRKKITESEMWTVGKKKMEDPGSLSGKERMALFEKKRTAGTRLQEGGESKRGGARKQKRGTFRSSCWGDKNLTFEKKKKKNKHSRATNRAKKTRMAIVPGHQKDRKISPAPREKGTEKSSGGKKIIHPRKRQMEQRVRT